MNKLRRIVEQAVVEALQPDINIRYSELEFLRAIKKLGGVHRWVQEYDVSELLGIRTSRTAVRKARRLESLGLLEIDESQSRDGAYYFKLTPLSTSSELCVWTGRSETGDDLGRHHIRMSL